MSENRIGPGEAIILALMLPVAVFLVGGVVINEVAEIAAFDVDSFAKTVLTTIGIQGVGIGVVAFFYYRWRGDPIEHLGLEVPTWREIAWAAGGLIVLLGLWMGTNVVAQYFGISLPEHQLGTLSEPNQLLIFIGLSLLVVAPGEELLYRGLIQGTLREAFGPASSIAGASLLFAPMHVPAFDTTVAGSGAGMFVTIGLVLVLSVVLGYLYERTETLLVPILVHGGFNGLQFGLRYLDVTGGL